MRNKLVLISIIAVVLFAGFCFLGSQNDTSMIPILPEVAVESVKKTFDEKTMETVTNFENPKVEEVVFKKQPAIYYFDSEINLVGKSVYKITFNTTQDGLLGPMVFYVDKSGGELIGIEYRE